MAEKKEDSLIRRLSLSPEIRKINEEERTVEFVASDNSVDSYKTVLPVDHWDLTRYEKNGVVGYMHQVYGDSLLQSADPDDVIGKAVAFVEGDELIVRITFEPESLNKKADTIFRKIVFGSLKSVSVGFLPTKKGHMGNPEMGEIEGVYYYAGQELLEVSVVNVPSNKNAVKRIFGTDCVDAEAARRSYARQTIETGIADDVTIIAKARCAMAPQ